MSGPPGAEPTALAALALAAGDRTVDAQRAIDWIASQQAADGSVGPMPGQATPGWPTSLAVLAAQFVYSRNSAAKHAFDLTRAINWICQTKGESLPRNDITAHDTTIVAWPWVADTHSWIEPTSQSILALKAIGRAADARAQEGARMIIDRLLPSGGCNYGNTFVMGQELRPHLQPTALAMLALSGQPDATGTISKSLDYLSRELSPSTASASLSYGLMALAAYGRAPRDWMGWLENAYRRTVKREPAPYRLALIALAALGDTGPLALAAKNTKSTSL